MLRLSDKDLSKMKFDELRKHYKLNVERAKRDELEKIKKAGNQTKRLERLHAKYDDNCRLLIEHGFSCELVDSLSREQFETHHKRISRNINFERTTKRPRIVTLAERKKAEKKKTWKDEQVVLLTG